MANRSNWPQWWEWELELSGHLLRRMAQRDFGEGDLREMMGDATGLEKDMEPGRWVISTRRFGRKWEIIVEPDAQLGRLVVVTAYMVE